MGRKVKTGCSFQPPWQARSWLYNLTLFTVRGQSTTCLVKSFPTTAKQRGEETVWTSYNENIFLDLFPIICA